MRIQAKKKRSRKMRKVWKTIGTVLALLLCAVFAFALVCNLTIIIKGTLHPDTPPTVFGVAPMVVLGLYERDGAGPH